MCVHVCMCMCVYMCVRVRVCVCAGTYFREEIQIAIYGHSSTPHSLVTMEA